MLGFLDVSLGNYETAVETLRPLMAMLDAVPDSSEVINASYVPDAAEALDPAGPAGGGRADSSLQWNATAQRLDRPWMKAVGARCRGMLLAATRRRGGRGPSGRHAH